MKFSLRSSSLALFCLTCVCLTCIAYTGAQTSSYAGSNSLAPPKFLYSTDFANNLVYEYLIDASTGIITPTTQVSIATGSGPGRVVSDQGGYRLYVADTGSKELSAYFINRDNGSLQAVPGSPFAVPGYPAGVAVHPSGDYVYVTTGENYVAAFAVQSDGSLVTVSGSPFKTQDDPVAIVVAHEGDYVYVSDLPTSGGPYVDAYVVDKSTGALTPVAGEPYIPPGNTSGGPECAAGTDLAVEPTGSRLLVPGLCDGEIVVYNIDGTTGALTNTKGSPVTDPPPTGTDVGISSIAVDPLNRWWYLYEVILEPLSMPSGDLATLTSSDKAERTSSQQCGDIVRADPSGKFVYAIGNTTGNGLCGASPGAILGFSVNQSTGVMTPLPGSPFASPTADSSGSETDGLAVTR
jgi:6-phosphogluconolactonase (cycloisomerase 2 family)